MCNRNNNFSEKGNVTNVNLLFWYNFSNLYKKKINNVPKLLEEPMTVRIPAKQSLQIKYYFAIMRRKILRKVDPP